jgi:spermidine synthase
VTVVVAGFLLGLGFGSLAGGQLSRRVRFNLLALFGAIELGIGSFGLVSLNVFEFIGRKTLHLPFAALTAVMLLLLLVPTLLMGSTLPILTSHLVRQSRNVGQSVGLLYCVNTVGSAAACFAAAFFLMRVAGMQGCIAIAASLNVAVGGLALLAGSQDRRRNAALLATPATAVPSSPPPVRIMVAIGAAALIGFVSLSYEIIWFRVFSIATNASPAFALILGIYLAGVANGAMRVRRSLAGPLTRERASDLVSLALLASSVLGFLLLPAAAFGAASPTGFFFPMLLLIFAQTTISGIVFPVICHYSIDPDRRTGARVSFIYLASILGSVAGTLITGFELMNRLSIEAISTFLGVFGTALALAAALLGGPLRPRGWAVGAAAMIAMVLMPLLSAPLFDRFYDRLLTNNLIASQSGRAGILREVVENRHGVIAVDEDLYVYGSGMYDGRIAVDLMHDENLLIRPFALSLYHDDPKDVLMVGLATGAWAQVIANHPGVKHLTVVEINPGYVEIIRRHPVVASLLDNSKVDILVDDGRRWLNRHPDRHFDVIVQNTTWYFRPNVTNLLSREYLQLAAAHLNAGGIIMYNTTGSLRVQRTGCAGFRSGIREINMLVVAPGALQLDPRRLRESLEAYRIDGHPVFDLAQPAGRERLDQIMSSLLPPSAGAHAEAMMEDCSGILARSSGLNLVSDDNMGEEWSGLLMTDPLLKRLKNLLP